MKNSMKKIAAAATALCLLAAPSSAMAEGGVWDKKGTYQLATNGGYGFQSGGGDVQFCITGTLTSYSLVVHNPITYEDHYAISSLNAYGNCAVFRGIGGAGYYMLKHRYAGQDALTGPWYD